VNYTLGVDILGVANSPRGTEGTFPPVHVGGEYGHRSRYLYATDYSVLYTSRRWCFSVQPKYGVQIVDSLEYMCICCQCSDILSVR